MYRVLIFPAHDSQSRHLYYSGALGKHAYATGFHRAAFQVPPGVSSIRLSLSNVNNDLSAEHDDPSCWTHGGASAWFGRFRLEAGRGVSTEAHSVGLMGQVQTTGARLTAQPAISVTHPFHTIAAPVPAPAGGPVAIQTITPPAGFGGMVVLHAIGAWTTRTDGRGPGRIGTALSMTDGATVFGWYDTTRETWWFTQAT